MSAEQKYAEKLYQVSPQFVLREVAGESVLIAVGDAGPLTNSIISLNESSVFIWNQFTKPVSVQSVIENAKAVYNDPDGIMEEEICRFVQEYVKLGLFREV